MKKLSELKLKLNLLNRTQYLRGLKQASVSEKHGFCSVCGGFGPYRYQKIINDDLSKTWNLDATQRELFDHRESMYCIYCGCSQRLRNLALAINLTFCVKARVSNYSLDQSVSDGVFNNMAVAEVNSCGKLHNTLKNIKNLKYSEYKSNNPKVKSQNLMRLDYKDDQFDLLLTSDTLEHIPDPMIGLKEIHRVLKSGGYHIFTVPIMLTRRTINRTSTISNNVHNIKEASYHGSGEMDYLVWNEFGYDFIDKVSESGFDVQLYFVNILNLEDPSVVFVTKKSSNNSIKKHYYDPTIELDKFNLNKLVNKIDLKFTSIKYVNKFDGTIQADKIEKLIEKIDLTTNHANNLKKLLTAQKVYTKELENKLHTKDEILNSHLIKYQAKVIKRFKKL